MSESNESRRSAADRTIEINWRETYIYPNALNGADLAPDSLRSEPVPGRT